MKVDNYTKKRLSNTVEKLVIEHLKTCNTVLACEVYLAAMVFDLREFKIPIHNELRKIMEHHG